MWDTIEAVFYILLFLLFLTTFMPKRVQRNVADSTYHVWRFLKEFIRWLEPRAYRLVTGRDPYARSGTIFPTGWGISQRGGVLHTPNTPDDLHAPVENNFPLPAAENAALYGGEPTVESGEIASATPDEVQAIGRALRHKFTSADKTKSGAIKAGWGLSRFGTDPRYRRASQLYDLATKPDEAASRFPELTPHKQQVLPKASRTVTKS